MMGTDEHIAISPEINITSKIEKVLWQPWRAILVCGLGSLFYLYEFILQVSPAEIINDMMRDLATDAAGIGLVSGLYYLTYTFMQLPAGLLYDRFGAQRVLSVAVGLCAIGAFLFGSGQTLLIVTLGRLFMGIGSAFSFIGALVLIAHWFPPRYFALLAGCAQLLSSVGAIIGTGPLGKAVAAIGWRHTMVVLGMIGLLLMLAVSFWVKDSPKGRLMESREIDWRTLWRNLCQVCSRKQTWWVSVYAFCIWAPVVMFAALWGTSFIKYSYHTTDAVASFAVDMIWIGVGIASPLLGWWSDKIKRRVLPLTLAGAIGSIAAVCAIYLPGLSMSLVYILMFLIGFAAGGQSMSFGLVNDNNPKSLVGTAVGINNMVVVLGGLVLQPLGGFLLKFHWSGAMDGAVPLYTAADYHFALAILPLFYIIATIVSLFTLKETYTKSTV